MEIGLTLSMPRPSLSARFLIWCAEAAARWSVGRRVALSALGFGACGLVEWHGPFLFNVTFFYLLACDFSILGLGERWGMVASTAGACLSALIKHVEYRYVIVPDPVTPAVEIWGLASRLLCFALLTLLVHGLRGILDMERWRGNHDGLTGALNKQAFEEAMVAQTAVARRDGKALLFVYMDLDGFKTINDQHGHAAGDRVLRLFAAAAVRVIREGDLFARMGGDEFAVLLTLPPEIDGARVAELLHERLSAVLRETALPVTCSMGALALAPDRVGETGALFEQADALMYEAKRNGKDGLRIARGGTLAASLRSAYAAPPDSDGELEKLLAWVDQADRRPGRRGRRAA